MLMIKRILATFTFLLTMVVFSPAIAVEPTAVSVVNVNTADAETMAKAFKGIGLKKAQAIVAYREKYGTFKAVAEVADVKGIGSALLSKNEGVMVVE